MSATDNLTEELFELDSLIEAHAGDTRFVEFLKGLQERLWNFIQGLPA